LVLYKGDDKPKDIFIEGKDLVEAVSELPKYLSKEELLSVYKIELI
jgi:hypothetical protein